MYPANSAINLALQSMSFGDKMFDATAGKKNTRFLLL